MNKYTVVYEIHNGEYPMPLEQNETIEIYEGTREFYEEYDGDVWNREVE